MAVKVDSIIPANIRQESTIDLKTAKAAEVNITLREGDYVENQPQHFS